MKDFEIRSNSRLRVVLFLMATTVTGHLFSAPAATLGQETSAGYTALGVVRYDAIRNLLGSMALDREALIALNLSASQVEEVLATVRSWYVTNETAFAALEKTAHEKTHALYVLQKEARLRESTMERTTELQTARQDLVAARRACQDTKVSLAAAIATQLTSSQRLAWTALQIGSGLPMPFRMMEMDAEEQRALSVAGQVFRRQRATAENPEQRSAAQATYNATVDGILTSEQKAVVAGYKTYVAGATVNVDSGLTRVLTKNRD